MKKMYSLIVFVCLAATGLRAQPPIDLFNIQEVTLKNGLKVVLFGKAYSAIEETKVYPASYRAPIYRGGSLFQKLNAYRYARATRSPVPGIIEKPAGGPAAKDNEYYYLPANLRLSKRLDTGVPEFLFLKYVTEEREDQGGISGALVHFLMEWGLTEDQRKECETALQDRIKGAKVVGPVMLQQGDGETFNIISATVAKDNKDMTRSLVTSGQAPLLPGQKIAAAANLSKYGSQLLAATFNKSANGGQTSITDLSVNLKYKYQARIPACKGRVIINWTRIATLTENYISSKTTTTSRKNTNSLSGGGIWGAIKGVLFGPNEVKTVTNISKTDSGGSTSTSSTDKTVQIIFEENYSDERVAAIRDAFFKIIEDMVSKALALDEEPLISPDEKATAEQLKTATDALDARSPNYTYTLDRFKTIEKRGTQTMDLNVGLMVSRDYFITENLAAWYDEVKDNPNCVTSVNLNDPFYKHLDIRFILDLEAKEMFDQEVNYVTVNVRKKRSSGNDFTDRVTIDKKYVTDKGIAASMSYAGGEDKNPDNYQYMTQWSLRGGNVFPKTPQWQAGQMEAVTLEPPVVPRTVEFEADLDKLKAAGISRVTLQVRYKKYDEEIEDNINISPAKNEPLVSKMLFMDRDTRGYVYRLVFNSTTEGKMALPWSARINDYYVYAVIPEGLTDKTTEVFNKAVEAGKTIVTVGADGKVTTDKVLDAFKDILGAPKNN
jgi:hypothetical protein